MLKLIATVAEKQTTSTAPEESNSEFENVALAVKSIPVKAKTTATTLKTTPVNSRNRSMQMETSGLYSKSIKT